MKATLLRTVDLLQAGGTHAVKHVMFKRGPLGTTREPLLVDLSTANGVCTVPADDVTFTAETGFEQTFIDLMRPRL